VVERCGNLDPTPGEAAVNARSPSSFIPGYAQNFWIGALEEELTPQTMPARAGHWARRFVMGI